MKLSLMLFKALTKASNVRLGQVTEQQNHPHLKIMILRTSGFTRQAKMLPPPQPPLFF